MPLRCLLSRGQEVFQMNKYSCTCPPPPNASSFSEDRASSRSGDLVIAICQAPLGGRPMSSITAHTFRMLFVCFTKELARDQTRFLKRSGRGVS